MIQASFGKAEISNSQANRVERSVGVPTVRYGGTSLVSVNYKATDVPEGWQVLGPFVVDIPSGEMIFWAPETIEIVDTRKVSLPPGRYQGTVYARGEEQVVDEMAEDGPDEYLVVVENVGL